jgi:pimeloyl-ACP methyl ester carboxylesterase
VKLALFPGLGADARMFHPQRDLGCAVEFPPLPGPRRSESLARYAARIELPPPPLIVGGVSMGGMVALELARARRGVSCLLISSSRNPRMVPPLLRQMSWILRLAPNLGAARPPRWRVFTNRLGALSDSDRDLLADALHSHPLDRLRELARMVVEWRGVEDPGVPTFHIHGERDLIIPIRFVRADAVIAGAGHAANMTHAEEVNRHIRRFVKCTSERFLPRFHPPTKP